MPKSGILKLAVAAFTIASAIGLTGMGAQAADAIAVPNTTQAVTSAAGPHLYTAVTSATVVLRAVSVDFICPDRTLCLFQDPGLTGSVREFPMPDSGDIWFPIREGGFTVPWGSLNDKTGSRVIFRNAQTGVEYCQNAGYRDTPPSSAERSTGYLYIQYGVPNC